MDHEKWGSFGSYVSGIYGTLAFLVLAYTTDITRKQFKIQNEDNIFFKLCDSLENRITNSSVIVNDTQHIGQQALKAVTNRFHEELSMETIEIARLLLCTVPEKIATVHYMKLFEAIWSYLKLFEAMKGHRYLDSYADDMENFINDINRQPNFNSRWDLLKNYIGSTNAIAPNILDALRAMGSVNFYKIPFSERRLHYVNVVQRISNEYGELLDGYFRSVCFLLEFSASAVNKDIYVEYLKAKLTKYELIIIFYLVAGREDELDSMKYLLDFGIMNGLFKSHCNSLMLDLPSNEELEYEIRNVFSDTHDDWPYIYPHDRERLKPKK
jgi:hypothetical protein